MAKRRCSLPALGVSSSSALHIAPPSTSPRCCWRQLSYIASNFSARRVSRAPDSAPADLATHPVGVAGAGAVEVRHDGPGLETVDAIDRLGPAVLVVVVE